MRLKLVGWGTPRLSRQHLSIAQDHDECASYYSQHAEMSWPTALTVLTVLTLVARFESELILIDSFPQAPRGRRITSHEKEGCVLLPR